MGGQDEVTPLVPWRLMKRSEFAGGSVLRWFCRGGVGLDRRHGHKAPDAERTEDTEARQEPAGEAHGATVAPPTDMILRL